MKGLTIIIPTLADKEAEPYLRLCLEAIKEVSPEHRIIVAVNGSGAEETQTNFDGANTMVIKIPEKGQCRAVNRAVELVDTEYMLVINDDMVVSPDWDKPLLENIEKYKCVSPNLVEPGGGAPPFLTPNDFGKTAEKFDARAWLEFTKTHKDNIGIEDGYNLPFMTLTEVFKGIGGYDEKYDPSGSNSDPDMMCSMMLAGIAPKRIRTSLVYHFSLGRGSMERDAGAFWHNWRYFPQKWGFERDATERIWYGAGENGTRIPTKERPYISESAAGAGKHPGKDWLEYKPEWMGKYGEPIFGKGKFYD